MPRKILVAVACTLVLSSAAYADRDKSNFNAERSRLQQAVAKAQHEHNTEQVIHLYKQLIDLAKAHDEAFYQKTFVSYLAQTLVKNERWADFKQLEDSQVKALAAVYGQNSMQVAHKLDDAAQLLQNTHPKPNTELAEEYSKQADEVIEQLKARKAIEAQSRGLRKAALEMVVKKNYAGAEAGLSHALEVARTAGTNSPELPAALVDLAYVKETLKKDAEAAALYKEALDLLAHNKYATMQYQFAKGTEKSKTQELAAVEEKEAVALYLRLLQHTGRAKEAEAFWAAHVEAQNKHASASAAGAGTAQQPVPKRDLTQFATEEIGAINSFKEVDSRNGVTVAAQQPATTSNTISATDKPKAK